MRLAIGPIVDRLKAGGCKSVDGVIEFGALTEIPSALPAQFVVPTAADTVVNSLDGGRNQRVVARISVMIVIEAARRHRAGVIEDLKTETQRVEDALVGWTHPEASSPFDFAGGRLASADGRTVVWEYRVTAPYHIRKAS